MKERESSLRDKKINFPKKVSTGLLVLSVLLAFIFGTRLQVIGDYFFSRYNNSSNVGLSQNLDYGSVDKVYDLLKSKYDGKLDATKLQDGLQKGLVDAAGDPYTVYMSAKEASDFQSDLDGTFSGIGAELGKQNDKLVVIAPMSESPAQKAGVKAGDIIVKINNEDTSKISVDAAVDKIRGDEGTVVKLGLIRGDSPLDINVTRAQITVPSVKSEILEGNIGYLQITRFSEDTADLANKAAQDFKSKNVKGIVLDVRNDGGGLLDASVKVAGLWLDNKVVVEEKQGGKTTESLRTGNNPPLSGIKTTMLINEGSASASEILAGALHDHGAAKLVGKKSFGKGSVQELINLDGGAKLKVTVARWYTPNGKNIDKEGIKPDIDVELSPEDINAHRDPQKDRAISELR